MSSIHKLDFTEKQSSYVSDEMLYKYNIYKLLRSEHLLAIFGSFRKPSGLKNSAKDFYDLSL